MDELILIISEKKSDFGKLGKKLGNSYKVEIPDTIATIKKDGSEIFVLYITEDYQILAEEPENYIMAFIKRRNKQDDLNTVSPIINKFKTQKEILLAIHSLSGQENDNNELKNRIKKLGATAMLFIHVPSDEIWGNPTDNKLQTLIYLLCEDTLQKEEISKCIKNIAEAIKKKPIIPNFSLLKHRIAHLWLPLDIDLQGISEVRRKKAEEVAKEYLEDMLRNKQKNYYRQKLADLQYMITGLEFGSKGSELNDPCKNTKPVEPSKEIKEFIDKNGSILKLIEEWEKGKSDLIKEWQEEAKGKIKRR